MRTWKKYIKNTLMDILDTTNESLKIGAYSLSSRVTIDAINELSQEYQSRIALMLIHPAYNPLDAIKVMDWKKTPEFLGLQENEHYLMGDPNKVFNMLISGWEGYSDWKGDGIQFQKDLRWYNARRFRYEDFQQYVERLPYDIKILGDKIKKDRVIHDLEKVGYSKEKRGDIKVLASHLVSLNDRDFQNFKV